MSGDRSSAVEQLVAGLSRHPDSSARIDALVRDVAALVRATSNDQNVQRLARDLEAAAPALSAAVISAPERADAGV